MKQTKRILSMLLCFVLLGTMLPLAAFAADAPQIYVGGVGMYDGDYLVAGATETTTEKPADNYAYYMDAVLTLHNYSYEGSGTPWDIQSYAGIYAPNEVWIKLEGSNSIRAVSNGNSDAKHLTAIYSADHVTFRAGSTDDSLNLYGEDVGVAGEAGVSVLGGTHCIVGAREKAIHYGRSTLERSLDLVAVASETSYGTGLVPYAVENNASYKTVMIGKDLHGHTYGAYDYDDEYHWQMCADPDCPNTDDSIRMKDTHDYADSADTRCHTCDYTRTPGSCVLTVQGGEGSGTYAMDTYVDISAQVPEGAVFGYWEVVTPGISVTFTNETSAETTVLVPSSNVTIRPVFLYKIVVTNGFATMSEAVPGEEVTVMANSPAMACARFDVWKTDGITLVQPDMQTVTFTMPENAVYLQPVYVENHTGGAASCTQQAVCETCESPYGELAEHDFTGTDGSVCKVCGESKFCPVYIGTVGLREGMYLASGSAEPTDTMPSGGYAHYSAGTLTLNEFSYLGGGYGYKPANYALIYSGTDLNVTLVGANRLVQHSNADIASGIVSDGEYGVTVSGEGGMLDIYTDVFGIEAVNGDVNILDCQIYMEDVYNGIAAAGDVLVNGAQLEIVANNDGISAEGDFTMNSGMLNITAVDDGIGAASATFGGGVATIYSDSWGMYISGRVFVNGGNVTADGGYRGIYSDLGIQILGGELLAIAHAEDEEDISAIYFDYELEDSNLELDGAMVIDGALSADGPMGPIDNSKIFQYKVLRIRHEDRAKDVYVGIVGLDDGEYVEVGGQEATTTKPDGGYAYYNDGVLTLHDFSYNGTGYEISANQDNAMIYAQDDLTIRLEGSNALAEGAMADHINGIELAEGCSLTVTGTGSLYIAVESIGICAYGDINLSNCDIEITDAELALGCDGDMTVNGAHILADHTEAGIVARDVTLNSGSLEIREAVSHAVLATGDITVNGGSVSISGAQSGIYTINGEVAFNGGKSNITGGICGIFALENVSFTGGELTVSATGTEHICAVYSENGTFVPASGTKVKASKSLSGSMEDYVPENLRSYLKIAATGSSAVSITKQPESVSVKNGETAKTAVVAEGDGLTYTWYFTSNGSSTKFSKSSTTTATYSTTMDATRDGRKVYCVITDKYGNSVTTDTVTLSMEKTPLVITQQPADVTVVNGASAKTIVKATGDGLKYTWYFTSGGSSAKFSKSSATSATYSTTMNADRSGRQVYCVITDAYGRSVTSETATLYMKEAIKITAQPQNVKVPANQTATVTVEAEGEDLTYTWYYANKGKTTFTKSSYTTNTYSTIMDSTRDGRRVYCKITDKLGNSVKTVTVTMTMHTPLVITQQPANVMAAEGAKAATTVKAEGDGLKYAWYYTSGGSSTTFSKSSITTATYSTTMDTARDGRQVYCVITDKHGDSVTTNTVTLSMKPRTPLVITQQPANVSVGSGATAKTTVKAEGDGLKYAWYYTSGGTSTKFSKSSITSASYSTTMDASRDGRKIYCIVTDQYGNTVKSNTVTLSMEKTPLAITQQPTDVTVAKGAKAATTVKATGDGLKYTWYYTSGGTSTKFSKSSITSATYSTTMDATRDGRQVYCVITDAYGRSVTTNTVTLSMAQSGGSEEVRVPELPESITVGNGKTVSVTVEATGEGLSYQWYYTTGGTATKFYQSSNTTATYSTTMDSSRDGRQICCVITDAYGNTVTSNTVTLKMG